MCSPFILEILLGALTDVAQYEGDNGQENFWFVVGVKGEVHQSKEENHCYEDELTNEIQQ